MKVAKSGFTKMEYSVKLDYNDILELLRAEGADIGKFPIVNVLMKSTKTTIGAKFGVLRDPSQILVLTVIVTEDHD